MFYITTLSFLFFFAIHQTNSFEVRPLPFSSRVIAPKFSTNCTTEGWFCQDCNTLRFCDSQKSFDIKFICKEQYSDKPFCSFETQTCIATNTCNSTTSNSNFICPDKNIYPDINNCRQYIICTEENSTGEVYECMFNGVYDSINKRCTSSKTCFSAKTECNGKTKVIAYEPDSNKYIICRGDDPPILKSCENENLEFDPKTEKCKFVCKKSGLFKHPDSNYKFYYCIYFDGWMQYEADCPEDTIFDEQERACVPDSDDDDDNNNNNNSGGITESIEGSGYDSKEYIGL